MLDGAERAPGAVRGFWQPGGGNVRLLQPDGLAGPSPRWAFWRLHGLCCTTVYGGRHSRRTRLSAPHWPGAVYRPVAGPVRVALFHPRPPRLHSEWAVSGAHGE